MQQEFRNVARNQMDAASALTSIFVAGAGKIAAEALQSVELTFRNNATWLRELSAVKSVPELVQVQTETAKANYAAMVEQTKKFGAVVSEMVEGAMKSMPGQEAAAPVLTSAPAKPDRKAA